MEEFKMDVKVASRLVMLRAKYGFSQEELAEKIGVSRQAVSKWERAESSPDTDNLIALAKIYDLTIDDMLYSEDNNADDKNKLKEEKYNAKYYSKYDDTDKLKVHDKQEKSKWAGFPYPIIATIIYFIIGYLWDAWHPGWLIFLTIPIWAYFV